MALITVFAGSWPVLKLLALKGHPLTQRVTVGPDPEILQWAQTYGWRVALVGGSAETKAGLQRELGDAYAQTIAGLAARLSQME